MGRDSGCLEGRPKVELGECPSLNALCIVMSPTSEASGAYFVVGRMAPSILRINI